MIRLRRAERSTTVTILSAKKGFLATKPRAQGNNSFIMYQVQCTTTAIIGIEWGQLDSYGTASTLSLGYTTSSEHLQLPSSASKGQNPKLFGFKIKARLGNMALPRHRYCHKNQHEKERRVPPETSPKYGMEPDKKKADVTPLVPTVSSQRSQGKLRDEVPVSIHQADKVK